MKSTIVGTFMMKALGAAALLGLGLAALPALGQHNEGAEIEAVSQQYREAWQRGDLDAVMNFWTEDAQSIGSGAIASGKAAIRASLEQSKAIGIYDLRHENREVYGTGGTVVEVTRSVLYDRSGKAILTMRYMTLWQKSGGQWRIHREFVLPAGAPGA